MSFLLPSDMGRLIYGYLQTSCSEQLAEEFLNTSDSMKECRKYRHVGFNAKVHDRTLTQMLNEYSLLSDLIFEHCNENERSHFNVVNTLQNLLKSKVSSSRFPSPIYTAISESPETLDYTFQVPPGNSPSLVAEIKSADKLHSSAGIDLTHKILSPSKCSETVNTVPNKFRIEKQNCEASETPSSQIPVPVDTTTPELSERVNCAPEIFASNSPVLVAEAKSADELDLSGRINRTYDILLPTKCSEIVKTVPNKSRTQKLNYEKSNLSSSKIFAPPDTVIAESSEGVGCTPEIFTDESLAQVTTTKSAYALDVTRRIDLPHETILPLKCSEIVKVVSNKSPAGKPECEKSGVPASKISPPTDTAIAESSRRLDFTFEVPASSSPSLITEAKLTDTRNLTRRISPAPEILTPTKCSTKVKTLSNRSRIQKLNCETLHSKSKSLNPVKILPKLPPSRHHLKKHSPTTGKKSDSHCAFMHPKPNKPVPWDYTLRQSIIDDMDNIKNDNHNSKENRKNKTKKDHNVSEKNSKGKNSKRKHDKRSVVCKKQRMLEEVKKITEAKKGNASEKHLETSKLVSENDIDLSVTTLEKCSHVSKQVLEKIQEALVPKAMYQADPMLESQQPNVLINNKGIEHEEDPPVHREMSEEIVLFYRPGRGFTGVLS